MLASRFYTKRDLGGPMLVALLDVTLAEYPDYPDAQQLAEEFDGYDMLELITLCSNICAVLDTLHTSSRALAWLFGAKKMLFLQQLLNNMRLAVRGKLESNNLVRSAADDDNTTPV